MHMGRGEERVRGRGTVTCKLTLPYARQTDDRSLLCVSGNSTGALYQPRGWDGAGDGRELQKGGDVCIPMADS